MLVQFYVFQLSNTKLILYNILTDYYYYYFKKEGPQRGPQQVRIHCSCRGPSLIPNTRIRELTLGDLLTRASEGTTHMYTPTPRK